MLGSSSSFCTCLSRNKYLNATVDRQEPYRRLCFSIRFRVRLIESVLEQRR